MRYATPAETETIIWLLKNKVKRPVEIDQIEEECKVKQQEAFDHLQKTGEFHQELMKEILQLRIKKEEVMSAWITKMTAEKQ